MVLTLLLFCAMAVRAQNPAGAWKTIKDAKGLCQITVPEDWTPVGDAKGAVSFQDPTIALAVVTSQPGQEFRPLNATLLKTFGIPKARMFENSAARIFYQDKVSRNAEETAAFSASVPAGKGTCSCRVSVLPSIPEDVAKKIVISLSPAPAKTP